MTFKLVRERDDPTAGDEVLYRSGDLVEIARFCESRAGVGGSSGDDLGITLNGEDLL